MAIELSDTEAQGRAIAAGRMLAGLDQAQLGQLAELAPSTISNVERGSDARDDTLRAIKRALRRSGVTISIDRTNGLALAAFTYEAPEDDE